MPDLSGMDRTCARYDTLQRGEYTVDNNAWRAELSSSWVECVYASPAGDRLAWTWDFSPESPDDVKAYPEVIFGKKPFAQRPSTTGQLPRPLTPLPSLKVDFALQTQASGRYNAAFEVWLTDSPAAPEASITHEVMFWVGYADGARPAGSHVRTVAMPDGRTCDLWIDWMPNWKYLAFVFHQPLAAGVIEFGYYLDYLVKHNDVPAGAYLADLEFGNEVWYGAGTTILDRYRVTVADGLVVPLVGPTPAPEPPVGPPPRDPARAYIRLELPAAARVYFEGVLTQKTGTVRVFGSTPLDPDRDYSYQLRVEVDGPDGVVAAERDVVVRAGAEVTESFWDAFGG